MKKLYFLKPTTNNQIEIDDQANSRADSPSNNEVDLAIRAYISQKQKYGSEAPIDTKLLEEGVKELRKSSSLSTFKYNFCGVERLFQYEESLVINRVDQAIATVDTGDLPDFLLKIFDALLRSDFPKKLRKRKQKFNMPLRTRFAVKYLSDKFWKNLCFLFIPKLSRNSELFRILQEADSDEKERLLYRLAMEVKDALRDMLKTRQADNLDGFLDFYKRNLDGYAAQVSDNFLHYVHNHYRSQ